MVDKWLTSTVAGAASTKYELPTINRLFTVFTRFSETLPPSSKIYIIQRDNLSEEFI